MDQATESAGGLTDQQREDLKTELQAVDDAEAPIVRAMEPLRAAISGLEQVRDIVLLRYGLAERPETCEGCERLILNGDKYHPTRDAGPLCEECAPTWGDVKTQLDERAEDPREDQEDVDEEIAAYRAHIAAGGTDADKVLYSYDAP